MAPTAAFPRAFRHGMRLARGELMAHFTRRGPRRALVAAALLGCGAAPEASTEQADAEAFDGRRAVETVAEAPAGPTRSERTPEVSQEVTDVSAAPPRCSPGPGASGSPRTIEQAVQLMNSLPRPTTLPCFIESLDRPLELYLTRSELSVQPANGARSPRTFIVKDDLLMAIVPDGELREFLEIGQLTVPGRSIKGEIEFPLSADVTASSITDHIRFGDVSLCGGCHGGETRPTDSFFVDGAFESAVAVPLPFYEVDLESLRREAMSCDADLEPGRCEMLGALFLHGDVEPSLLWKQ
jgi:hypothetical protein